MNTKKIVIVSYYFYPEITPRAFRTFSLAKELARLGHRVTLYIPEYKFDYTEMQRKYGFLIKKVKSGFLLNRDAKNCVNNIGCWNEQQIDKKDTIKNIINKILKSSIILINNICSPIYFDGRITEYAFFLAKGLLKDKNSYDALISIGLPFSVHLASAIAVFINKNLGKVKIMDCGDPFSKNMMLYNYPHYKYIEHIVTRMFDYITIPIEKAIESYVPFKDIKHIKVIPQGIDFHDIKLANYTKNKIPTFVYGGIFYKQKKNPKVFLDYLTNLNTDFKFIVYTDTTMRINIEILMPYKEKIGDKLIIYHFLPRSEFIFEASKADFLINIDWITPNQLSSKLIDYAVTNRPILSFTQENFSPSIFEEFLRGNYCHRQYINLQEHDIKTICHNFLQLMEQKE
jgi:hypothetical protein